MTKIAESNVEEYIGYLKYSGKSVEGGFLDTKKSAEALLGFDEILRYFILEDNPELKNVDYEIPVRVKKGTWGIWIPAGLTIWFAGKYLGSMATKAGSDGFFETGPSKDIQKMFKGSIIAAQWAIKIGSHVGTFAKRKFENIKIDQTKNEPIIKISNEQGKVLEVPKKYFDIYVKCPEKIFSKNAGLIEQERTLEIGVIEKGIEEKVFVTEKEKSIFYTKKDEEEGTLFPELKHNQYVELEGFVTRGNEKTNTIGFEYNGHILTCKPENRNIATFKNKIISQLENHFFPLIKIIGRIDRTDENHLFKNSRPMVIFSDIIPLEKTDNKQSLFDKNI